MSEGDISEQTSGPILLTSGENNVLCEDWMLWRQSDPARHRLKRFLLTIHRWDHGLKRMFSGSATQLLCRYLLKFSSDGHVRSNLCQSGNRCSTFYGDFLSVWSEGTDRDPKNVALHLSDIQWESKKDFGDQKRSSNIYGWTSQKFMGQKFHLFLDRHCLPLVACRFTLLFFSYFTLNPFKR